MLSKESRSRGGKVIAAMLKAEALKRYYANPKICLHCNEIIQVPEGVRCSNVKQKKFCNKSCAAKYNNTKYPKREKKIQISKIEKKQKIVSEKIIKNDLEKVVSKYNYVNKNKKEIFDNSKNWQSARTKIQKHARALYKISDKPKCCIKCGYDKHYQICHIKAVSDFNDDASIFGEINNIDNLIALCPNHHWEFDNGILLI